MNKLGSFVTDRSKTQFKIILNLLIEKFFYWLGSNKNFPCFFMIFTSFVNSFLMIYPIILLFIWDSYLDTLNFILLLLISLWRWYAINLCWYNHLSIMNFISASFVNWLMTVQVHLARGACAGRRVTSDQTFLYK